jgi:hypothetical protein
MGKRLNQGCPAHLPMLKNILGYLGKKCWKKQSHSEVCPGNTDVTGFPETPSQFLGYDMKWSTYITFPTVAYVIVIPESQGNVTGFLETPSSFLSYTTSVGLIGILMGLIGTGWLRPTFGSEMWRGFWKPHHKT